MSETTPQPVQSLEAAAPFAGSEMIEDPSALQLLSGQLQVLRTSGDMDPGWSVQAIRVDDENNSRRAIIIKEDVDSNGRSIVLEKNVELGKLLSYNQPQEEEIEALKYAEISPRLAEILAPIQQPAKAEGDDYGFLFNEEPPRASPARFGEATSKYSREAVTEDSERDAQLLLGQSRSHDVQIGEIVDHFTKDIDRKKIPEELRKNADFRLALGTYLNHKVSELAKHPHRMPPRVTINHQKSSNVKGYPSYMTSQEYAVGLAMSMLDGTFKKAQEDEIFYDQQAHEGGGQHRTAAKEILLSSDNLIYSQTPYS